MVAKLGADGVDLKPYIRHFGDVESNRLIKNLASTRIPPSIGDTVERDEGKSENVFLHLNAETMANAVQYGTVLDNLSYRLNTDDTLMREVSDMSDYSNDIIDDN